MKNSNRKKEGKKKMCGLNHKHGYYNCCAACIHGEHPSEGASGHVKECKYYKSKPQPKGWEEKFDERIAFYKEALKKYPSRSGLAILPLLEKDHESTKSFIRQLLSEQKRELLERIEKEMIGFNDRGIVQYGDVPYPLAICMNCGQRFKNDEAKKMMFGHIGCPKPNGYFLRNDFTVEQWQKLKKEI